MFEFLKFWKFEFYGLCSRTQTSLAAHIATERLFRRSLQQIILAQVGLRPAILKMLGTMHRAPFQAGGLEIFARFQLRGDGNTRADAL